MNGVPSSISERTKPVTAPRLSTRVSGSSMASRLLSSRARAKYGYFLSASAVYIPPHPFSVHDHHVLNQERSAFDFPNPRLKPFRNFRLLKRIADFVLLSAQMRSVGIPGKVLPHRAPFVFGKVREPFSVMDSHRYFMGSTGVSSQVYRMGTPSRSPSRPVTTPVQ